MRETAVEAKDLSVVRGNTRALDKVSFSIPAGKITGLIGPSGSGKTTLIRSIIGVQVITDGSLTVLSNPAGSKILRTRIGYVSQNPAVYGDLTVRQNLGYFAKIVNVSKVDVEAAIEKVDLRPQAGRIVNTLSGGQLARVSLAVALLPKADLLVLDEPTVGLDPVLRNRLWNLFKDLADEGRTLIISSHVMDEAERCPELLLLREGKVLSHGARESLLKSTGARSVEAAFLQLAGDGA